MPTIRRLAPEVASRIAAGEVIERPASVLKELIENAMDAGASRVDVESLSAGRKLLRVKDDGVGMEPEDCLLAFERHTTSKITELEDIDALSTFGFRGEALYSIAAVSRVSLASVPRNSRKGWQIEVTGGKLLGEHEAPPSPGTCVEVRDLFYNTPARAKFLKSETSEKGQMLRVIEEAALANPQVAFTYKSEGRAVLHYAGQKETKSKSRLEISAARARVQEILGQDLSQNLLSATCRRMGISVSAFVSPADELKPTRNFQYLMVNRRPVASRILQQALYRAYNPFRSKSLHPVAVLYVEIPSDQVDVNVHPTKREVRFSSERDIYETIVSTVSKVLLESKGIPTLLPGNGLSVREPQVKYRSYTDGDGTGEGERAVARSYQRPLGDALGAVCEGEGNFDLGAKTSLRFLGQIEQAYLVFDAGGGLLIVDQHAAQERILFERYLKELSRKNAVQDLMLPIAVTLPASSLQRVLSRREQLNHLGFIIEPFGKTTLHVTGVPAVFHKTEDVEELVHRVIDGALSPEAAAADTKYHATATIACKAAVKAHDRLGDREALQLMRDLSACQDGSCCPHGRPTRLSLTRDELARRFHRPGAVAQ